MDTVHACLEGVRDHLPLQQGLRQPSLSYRRAVWVRDHLPLQQGLRHVYF